MDFSLIKKKYHKTIFSVENNYTYETYLLYWILWIVTKNNMYTAIFSFDLFKSIFELIFAQKIIYIELIKDHLRFLLYC